MSVHDQVAKSLKLVGRVLGDKFKLTACIGIGGSGAVYRADQIALGRTVAVKILNEELSADRRMIKRFRDEAMRASRLNTPTASRSSITASRRTACSTWRWSTSRARP